MTGHRKSPKNGTLFMMSLFLKVGKQYCTGFWNVRTLLQIEKFVQVSKEMDYYSSNILDLSKCRWPRNEKFVQRS